MGDMSKHFSRYEFRCKCGKDCGYDAKDPKQIEILEKIREHFGKPVIISSSNRCPEYNNKPIKEGGVGSYPGSQHPRAKADDIVIENVSPEEIALYADKIMPDWGGIGIYDTFTHIDTRKNIARWDYRTNKGDKK
jgi:uncharacterized protein YcbK (DUF882 family)